MGARREIVAAVAERYALAGRREKGRILDELPAVTGWHRKHAVRALSASRSLRSEEAAASGDRPASDEAPAAIAPSGKRQRKYDAIRDALIALWEASDRICGKRLKVMIASLLPALERHGRLTLSDAHRRASGGPFQRTRQATSGAQPARRACDRRLIAPALVGDLHRGSALPGRRRRGSARGDRPHTLLALIVVHIMAVIEAFAQDGLRVLGVARARVGAGNLPALR